MSSLFRLLRKKQNDPGYQGKTYRILSNTAIIGLFLIVGIVVVILTGGIRLNSGIFGLLVTLGIICFGMLACLPWIRHIEKGEYKKLSIVFIILIGTCCLLWIICLWIGVSMFNQGANITNYALKLGFIKGTMIFSLQFMVASVVATNVVKLKKTYIPLQVITYLSYLIIDFYFTYLLAHLTLLNGVLKLDPAVDILFTRFMITLVSLAVAFALVSSVILKRMESKRIIETTGDIFINSEKIDNFKQVETNKTTQEKLEELNSLFQQQLITQQEYEQKRKEIIDNM